MGNAITQDSRALWLMLARSGNWWTVRLLFIHWQPTFAEWELEDLLAGLLAGGFVTRRKLGEGRIGYAVTSESNPLPGFDLAGNELEGRQHA